MLKYLIKDQNLIKIENVYLIGHGLGAHTAGFAARWLQEQKLGKIPVVFGLDPAGPLFALDNPDTFEVFTNIDGS